MSSPEAVLFFKEINTNDTLTVNIYMSTCQFILRFWSKGSRCTKSDIMLSSVVFVSLIALHLSSAQTPRDRCTHVIADSRDHVLEFKETCYYFVQQTLTWEQSRDACRTRDMVLASIPNNETNNVLYQRAVDLDFNDRGNKSSYFFGARLLNRQNDGGLGQITWEDGGDYSFTNFRDDLIQNGGECIIMAASLRGQWQQQQCDRPTIFTGYLCASEVRSSAAKIVTTKILLAAMFMSVLSVLF